MAATGIEVAESPKQSPPPRSDLVRLRAGALKEAVHCRNKHYVKAPPGATRDDVRHPSFWGAEAKKLRRHDEITLLADDETWQLELIVESVAMASAEVTVVKNIARVGIDRSRTWLGDAHYVEWRPGDGWCVFRASDDFPISRGHTLKVSAINQFHRDQPKAA